MLCKIKKVKNILQFKKKEIQFIFMKNIKITQAKNKEKNAYKESQLEVKTL